MSISNVDLFTVLTNCLVNSNRLSMQCLQLTNILVRRSLIRKRTILKLLLLRFEHQRLPFTISDLVDSYHDEDFHSHFRMTHNTFLKLMHLLESRLEKPYSGGNEPISVKTKVHNGYCMHLCLM